MLIRRQPEPLLTPDTLSALWRLCERAHRAAAAGPPAAAQVSNALMSGHELAPAPRVCQSKQCISTEPLLFQGLTTARYCSHAP